MTIELLYDINIRTQNKKDQRYYLQHKMKKKSKYEVIENLGKSKVKIYPYIVRVMIKDKRLIPLRKREFKIIGD